MSGNSNLTLVGAVTNPAATSHFSQSQAQSQARPQSVADAVRVDVATAALEASAAVSEVTVNKQAIELAPQYRLVIEPGPSLGAYVYKTVDPETGEVIRQFPREDLIRMREDPTYQAGAVADTRA